MGSVFKLGKHSSCDVVDQDFLAEGFEDFGDLLQVARIAFVGIQRIDRVEPHGECDVE
jgi:hypothetical protein